MFTSTGGNLNGKRNMGKYFWRSIFGDFLSSLTTSSEKFIKFGASNAILFQIKVVG